DTTVADQLRNISSCGGRLRLRAGSDQRRFRTPQLEREREREREKSQLSHRLSSVIIGCHHPSSGSFTDCSIVLRPDLDARDREREKERYSVQDQQLVGNKQLGYD